MSVSFSLSKAGLEVYDVVEVEKKDEKDKDKDKDKKDDKKKSDSSSKDKTTVSSDTLEAANNFKLETGEISKIYYIGQLYSDSFEQDYTDISSNSSVSLPINYINQVYKGRRVSLKKGWQTSDKFTWDKMATAITGFITEITWNKDKVEIKINGMDKLLDQEKKFKFTKTKRSEIVTKIIEAAGLKAKVDVTGLKDDVTNFTNISSSSKKSSGTSKSTGSASIDEAVQKAIDGVTDDLTKAKNIDKAFKSYIIYKLYYNAQYSDLEAAWKAQWLNCADGANVLCAMFLSAGLDAVILHVDPEYSEGYGHYIVRVKVNGQTYYTDNAASTGSHTTRPFGQVFGQPIGSEVGTKISPE